VTMRIGVPREIKPGENRVALTPTGARALVEAGAEVAVQAGAGRESGFPDTEYEASGARLVATAGEAWEADLVVKVKEPVESEYDFLSGKTALFTYLHLAAVPALAEALLAKEVASIAYETVREDGKLPLLRPMSEVAGMLAVQEGARGLEKINGGRGILLPGASGAPPASVCVIGAGVAGRNAARMAAGMGASVTVLDTANEKLVSLERELKGFARTVLSTPAAIRAAVKEADLVVSTVLVVGDKAPVLITRDLLKEMKWGAVVVDVAIDQGGSLETSRPTTHAEPFYIEEGVVHYCVTNMPGAVPRTSTIALTAATLPWILMLARSGVEGALRESAPLRAGLNTFRGRVTCEGVARALRKEYVPPERLLSTGEPGRS
jgi:alanine dehydrogenase